MTGSPVGGYEMRDGRAWVDAPSPRGLSNGRRDNRLHGCWVPKGQRVKKWVWTHEQDYSIVTGFELEVVPLSPPRPLEAKTLRELAVMMHVAEETDDDMTVQEVDTEVRARDEFDQWRELYGQVWRERMGDA